MMMLCIPSIRFARLGILLCPYDTTAATIGIKNEKVSLCIYRMFSLLFSLFLLFLFF